MLVYLLSFPSSGNLWGFNPKSWFLRCPSNSCLSPPIFHLLLRSVLLSLLRYPSCGNLWGLSTLALFFWVSHKQAAISSPFSSPPQVCAALPAQIFPTVGVCTPNAVVLGVPESPASSQSQATILLLSVVPWWSVVCSAVYINWTCCILHTPLITLIYFCS